ncbi:maltooligosyltrehalose trehalohydrolase [Rhodopseudomonas rhenobacensis]|uniref:Malto-oligosyltrehalose trehalohydrolase n=1 Tax=Rhodopseudomonas rhenobacensis TaxID=87461 RepID=A0A7W8E1D7_9BRAD|nr:malto-oligosyltrehalose trehalohydrolase [Rhodopseudomonas rhenobacensis]MBB5048786.1 maltooligosyltrehalose trehalohydrolase [Rhodopseudomonas rhenobacensis]
MDQFSPPAPTRFGPEIHDGGVLFRLWGPSQAKVELVIEGRGVLPMNRTEAGWHSLLVPGAGPGTRYRFRMADGLEVPDPASRYQPEDVHGPSEVVDAAAFAWSDQSWRGRPWEETVAYELHVGAFTEQGTFTAAIERLDYLAELGVTAIELMPVAEFPGARNWGYDGVLLFAPDASYGRPDDMKALVDAAHARGIMVFLDVVYNHFGPDGNYLSAYAPIFNDQHQTPWGAAVNYDAAGSKTVREFVIQNAIYWIDEFHLDGLRLDAVHAIKDDSDPHLLAEIPSRLRAGGINRPIHLMLENEENEVERLARDDDGEPLQYTAQWNDDLHHVLHTAASGERSGYYAEYAGDSEKLGRALAEGFAFQGDHMRYSDRSRGQPSRHLPPTAFVGFIQNHDQIGNRAFGERLTAFAPATAVQAAAAVYLLLPQIPMLFMGEEFASSRPFPFFCDFAGDLADAIREGRRKEFARFPEFADPQMREAIPDPGAATTFEAAKLDWNEPLGGLHAEWLALYRTLLAIRHREIAPRLKAIGGNAGRFTVLDRLAVRVEWTLADGAQLTLIANLTDQPLPGVSLPDGRRLWPTTPIETSSLGAWQVVWTISAPG